MNNKLLIVLLTMQVVCFACSNEPPHLLKFKNIEYCKSYISISNGHILNHYIYIKNFDLSNHVMLTELQEFALCYARSETDVNSIIFLDKYCGRVQDEAPGSKRMGVHIFRGYNYVIIKRVNYLEKGRRVGLNIPVISGNGIQCN